MTERILNKDTKKNSSAKNNEREDCPGNVAEPNYYPYCGSTNTYGISRVVGYYSVIDNWNKSKKAELKRRKQGNYWRGRD